MHEVFQFHFADAGSHYLDIQDGTLGVHEGEHDDPSVSLSMSTETLKGIMNGEINGMTAFMTGKLKATGNVMLATKLTSLFPQPINTSYSRHLAKCVSIKSREME